MPLLQTGIALTIFLLVSSRVLAYTRPVNTQVSRVSLSLMSKRAASSDGDAKPKRPKPVPVLGPPIVTPTFKPKDFNMRRARLLSDPSKGMGAAAADSTAAPDTRCVVYWMSRDQRLHDNHAVLYAQALAQERNVPLRVVFNLYHNPNPEWGTLRAYGFMLRGLREVESDCRALNIPFHLEIGDVTSNVPAFARAHGACAVVTDFNPLRHSLAHAAAVVSGLDAGVGKDKHIPLVQVCKPSPKPCPYTNPYPYSDPDP